MSSRPVICLCRLFIKAIRSTRCASVATERWLNDHHGDKWIKREANSLCLSVFLTLSHAQIKKRKKKRQSADPAFIPKETTTHYITENNSTVSLCLSRLYIFTIFIPSLLPPPRVPRPSGSPSLRHWNILSRVIGAILRVGMERKRETKRREPRGVKKETLRVIIRSNIILRLEVSWGHDC